MQTQRRPWCGSDFCQLRMGSLSSEEIESASKNDDDLSSIRKRRNLHFGPLPSCASQSSQVPKRPSAACLRACGKRYGGIHQKYFRSSRTVPVPLCRASTHAARSPSLPFVSARPAFRRARAHSQSSDAQRMSDSAGGSSDEPTSTLIGTLVAAFKERLAGGSKR